MDIISRLAEVTHIVVRGEPAPVQVTVANPVTNVIVVQTGSTLGDGGSGVSAQYEHQQSSPSNIWTVNHNLGKKYPVTVLSPGGIEVDAQIVHTSINQVLIYFKEPYAGSAVIG